MAGSDRDRLAQEAARLVMDGEVADVDRALRRLSERMRGSGGDLPSPARVRQHLEAMRMQQLGAEGYAQRAASRIAAAEDVLSAVDAITGGDPGYLVGRAASGESDTEGTVYLRVYTDLTAGHLADRLRDLGFQDPVLRSVRTRRGMIDALHFSEEGWPIILRICPPELEGDVHRDLFTGRRISVARWSAE